MEAIYWAVWLLLHDLPFAQRNGPTTDADLFPKGPLQGLVALALDQSLNQREITTRAVLDLVLDHGFPVDQYGTTAPEMIRIYDDLDLEYAVTQEERGRVVELVEAWIRQRRMGQALGAGLEALERGNEARATEALTQARQVNGITETPLRLDEHLTQALGDLPDNAIPTGFEKIDRRMWHGGARPGELGVVLAATNVGKTQTLCYMAAAAYKANVRVVYYTFELHQSQILRRIAAAVLRKPAGQIPIDEAPEMLRLIRVNREVDMGMIEIRSGTKTVSDLLLDIDELASKDEAPGVIFLDSADDLVATGKHNTEYTRAGEIYKDLRGLALAANVVVWTSTQATREAIEKSRINLKHIGDSFWKARRAHYVLGFSQTKMEAQNDPFGGSMSVFVLKDSQHGSPGRAFKVRPMFGPSRDGEGYPGFEDVEER